jgi:hypothetical protein
MAASAQKSHPAHCKMTAIDRALCAVTARLLQASSITAVWSLAVSVLAIGVLALTGRSLNMLAAISFSGVVFVGMLERYLAFRLRFDAGLFKDIANNGISSLGALDLALHRLGLRSASGPERALEDRVKGARQLLLRHGMAVTCQSSLFLVALLTQYLR